MKLISLLIILLLGSAFSIDYSKAKESAFKDKDCSFYSNFLEAKFKCGPKGYPIGYGYKYCNRFLEKYEIFTSSAQRWVSGTLLCLKKQLLVPLIYHDERDKKSCDLINEEAFKSHVNCYIENHFCEELKKNKLRFMIDLLQVYKIKDFFSTIAVKQVKSVLATCLFK